MLHSSKQLNLVKRSRYPPHRAVVVVVALSKDFVVTSNGLPIQQSLRSNRVEIPGMSGHVFIPLNSSSIHLHQDIYLSLLDLETFRFSAVPKDHIQQHMGCLSASSPKGRGNVFHDWPPLPLSIFQYVTQSCGKHNLCWHPGAFPQAQPLFSSSQEREQSTHVLPAYGTPRKMRSSTSWSQRNTTKSNTTQLMSDSGVSSPASLTFFSNNRQGTACPSARRSTSRLAHSDRTWRTLLFSKARTTIHHVPPLLWHFAKWI